MLMSPQDLAELTGYERPSAQISWLRARGWRFEIGGDNRPKVLRAYAEAQLGLKTERAERRPRLHLHQTA